MSRNLCVWALLSVGLVGCVSGSKILADSEVISSDIERARRSGALQCAPDDLAVAEAHLDFGRGELSQGNSVRASDHIRSADTAVKKALARSRDCASKTVLVKSNSPVVVRVEPTDGDGDGVQEASDRCPSEPEDRDGFQDDDGCPDPDNDADGVLDTQDRCPIEPGPEARAGCPEETPRDADEDGVVDTQDRCPGQPEDRDGFEDEDGCAEVDNDADGLLDAADKCPDRAGPPTSLGCPQEDRDGDGIHDGQDACVDEPEDKDGIEDADGCPDLDNDKDGVPDASDACAGQAEDRDGFQDEDGCPDVDNDGDRMPDTLDKCPMEAGLPELFGCPDKDTDGDGLSDRQDACPEEKGITEEKGCPKKYKNVVVKKDRIEIKQQILFKSGSALIIGRASKAILDDVALALKDNAHIRRVRIEGHTDDRGNDVANLRLSQNRSDSVKAELIKRGIDPIRLISVGYGEARPLLPNKTKAGRAANRRTEFNIVE
ncbi:MAG: OmpA family protein [Myxococcaceae bacterium]|nr:OmpA family protein [Myxococcaceae bacterium]MCI0672869.1 OmpA family protein [Myxococcaceae bacterium]